MEASTPHENTFVAPLPTSCTMLREGMRLTFATCPRWHRRAWAWIKRNARRLAGLPAPPPAWTPRVITNIDYDTRTVTFDGPEAA